MTALQIVQLLDLAVQVAQHAGVSMARYNAMRESSASGRLTPEQLQQLAEEARQSLNKL